MVEPEEEGVLGGTGETEFCGLSLRCCAVVLPVVVVTASVVDAGIGAGDPDGDAMSARFRITVEGRRSPPASSASSLDDDDDEEEVDEETSAVLSVISRPSSSTHSLSKSLRLKSSDWSSTGCESSTTTSTSSLSMGGLTTHQSTSSFLSLLLLLFVL